MKFRALEPVPYEGIWRQTGEVFEAIDTFDDRRAVKIEEAKASSAPEANPKATEKPVTKKAEAANAE